MANSFANLIKIWGEIGETAADVAFKLQDGMLAYCPDDNVAVWRRDESYYETLTSETKVLELIASNALTTVTTDATLTGSGTPIDPLGISDSLGWSISSETGDFTALDYTIHLVDTSLVDINATVPDATAVDFQTRIYKTSTIESPDVIVSTPSNQEIGGNATQLIQGASEGFFAVSHTGHYDVVQDNRGSIARKLSQSTTIISGYAISINGGDPTKIDVASGVFSEELAGVASVPPATSDLGTPLSKFVKTDALTAVTITGIATDGFTVFQIDSDGNIVQTLNDVPNQESENISPKIAVIVHAGGVVLSAEPWWTVGQNPSKRVSWLMGKLGILKEGVTTFGATVGSLQFAHDAGVLSYAGADGDKSPNNPDEQPVPAQDPVQGFILAKQDSFISFTQTVIDPTQIDVGGTLTTLTGNDKVSIQRIMINRNGTFTVQYGQNAYATLQDGLTALSEGTDTFVKFGVIAKVSRNCAYLIIDRTCADLTNTSLAQFVQTGLLESDASLSASSELVTLLKALQNGNSAGNIGITDLGATNFVADVDMGSNAVNNASSVEVAQPLDAMYKARSTLNGGHQVGSVYGGLSVTSDDTSGDNQRIRGGIKWYTPDIFAVVSGCKITTFWGSQERDAIDCKSDGTVSIPNGNLDLNDNKAENVGSIDLSDVDTAITATATGSNLYLNANASVRQYVNGILGTFIDNAGRVGVGTTTPSADSKMDINGIVKSQVTTAQIEAETTGKVLITKEYLGELRITIPIGGTATITSASAPANCTALVTLTSGIDGGTLPYMHLRSVSFTTGVITSQYEVAGSLPTNVNFNAVSGGCQIVNNSTTDVVEATVKAPGAGDATKLTAVIS